LEHPALLHGTVEEFLSCLVPFVTEGIDNGEPVFVAVGGEHLAALRDEVGDAMAGVTWADTHQWHPDPATRLRAFHELVSDELAGGATRLRLVGEPVWPTDSPELVLEWKRYESALNAVLGPFPVSLICTYDTSRLDPSITTDARRTHPRVREGAERASPEFEAPEQLLRHWVAQLPPPPADAAQFRGPVDLHALREFLKADAVAAGLKPDRARDLCLAASEVFTHALVHGGGGARLRAWRQDATFCCQIEDAGPGLTDPLAGYRPPSPAADSGRGLWLARQLVDLLQIVPTAGGTTVRLRIAC
jgi:anti-sigma regulatory factor (Ser/Thr protein kinase)